MKSIAYMEFKGSTSLYPFLRTALQLGILLNMGHWLFLLVIHWLLILWAKVFFCLLLDSWGGLQWCAATDPVMDTLSSWTSQIVRSWRMLLSRLKWTWLSSLFAFVLLQWFEVSTFSQAHVALCPVNMTCLLWVHGLQLQASFGRWLGSDPEIYCWTSHQIGCLWEIVYQTDFACLEEREAWQRTSWTWKHQCYLHTVCCWFGWWS